MFFESRASCKGRTSLNKSCSPPDFEFHRRTDPEPVPRRATKKRRVRNVRDGQFRSEKEEELVISLAKIRSASGAAESGLVSTCCCHRERVQNQQVRHLQTEVSALSFPLFCALPNKKCATFRSTETVRFSRLCFNRNGN